MHASGLRCMLEVSEICFFKYQAGQENKSADALSRSPRVPPPQCGIGQDEF